MFYIIFYRKKLDSARIRTRVAKSGNERATN